MNKHGQLWGVGGFLGMLCLILDSKTAIKGSVEGIDLCIQTLIPSLFPFFVFSILITEAFWGSSIPVLRPLGMLFHIPRGAESLLIPSFLGGYPVGASCISDSSQKGYLSKQQAEDLLAYCSNAGPSFIFGVIAPMFPNKTDPWIMWGIHIASAWMVSSFFIPEETTIVSELRKSSAFGTVMHAAVRSMALVCGWVVLFRVFLSFLNRWILWFLPEALQVLITGLLELSNGCCSLHTIPNPELRFFVCSGMLAFGGLCVTLQTVSSLKELSIVPYLTGKILQCTFTLLLSYLYLRGLYFALLLSILSPHCLSALFKKYSRNTKKAVV